MRVAGLARSRTRWRLAGRRLWYGRAVRALRLSLGMALGVGLCLPSVSCSQAGGSPDLDVHVDWGLTDPTVDIPAGVDRFRLLVWIGDATTPDETVPT